MSLTHAHLFPLVVFWGSLVVIGSLPHCVLTHGKETLQLKESYKAGMFIAALGARGITPPNLHTKGYYQGAYTDGIYTYSFHIYIFISLPPESLAYLLGVRRTSNVGRVLGLSSSVL